MTANDNGYLGQQTLWQSAEQAALQFMHTIGFTDAVTTSAGADGGLDVVATGAAAQVKALATPVGRPDLQRLRGASFNVATALFFSLNGYTPAAVAYATEARIALFTFGPGLIPNAVNDFAKHLALLAGPGQRWDPHPGAVSSAGVPTPSRSRWQQWSTSRKIAVVLFTPAAVTIAGPVLFAVGREASRRSAQGDPTDSSAQRRTIVTTAGVIGTVLLASISIQNLLWAVVGGKPADGSPGVGAVVGAAVGIVIVIALNSAVSAGRLTWLWVPRSLWTPQIPGTRDI
ncbi:restriction endonuclease [Dactylosporangium cerinum]|uniref:Restriction endonuclease n=1 Tax=Dactylosporangium cerinum TaxID=1434730 RepID=A0ABV9WGV3_9ACTN